MPNLNNGNITVENFVKKLINRRKIENNISIGNYINAKNNEAYLFKRISKYNFRNSVFAYVIESFFNYNKSEINVQLETQRHIHLTIAWKNNINCTKGNITEKIINKIKNITLNDPLI